MHYKHNWWPLFYSHEEFELNEKKRNNRFYFLCAGKTVIDEWCSKFEKNLGFNIKSGVNCASHCDIQVFGDDVYQIFIPQDIMHKIETLYRKIKNIDDLDISFILKNIFKRKSNILVVKTKNKELAEQIKLRTLSYFRKSSNNQLS